MLKEISEKKNYRQSGNGSLRQLVNVSEYNFTISLALFYKYKFLINECIKIVLVGDNNFSSKDFCMRIYLEDCRRHFKTFYLVSA